MKFPKKKKANGYRWVYSKKVVLSKNEGEKFKARLVAKNYSQIEGENAPVMLTKLAPIDKFKSCLDLIGVYS